MKSLKKPPGSARASDAPGSARAPRVGGGAPASASAPGSARAPRAGEGAPASAPLPGSARAPRAGGGAPASASRPSLPRPRVTANFALTWDGRTTTRKLTPTDFSSRRDKHRLLEIRSQADAVLASAKTVAADRMTMGMPDAALRAARLARKQSPYPLRVLLTNTGIVDPDLPIFKKDFSTIAIFSTTRMPEQQRAALAPLADLWLHSSPCVNLPAMLATLRQDYGVKRLVCEGGAQVFRSLLEENLMDDFHITLCPRIFGGAQAPTLTGPAGEFLANSVQLSLRKMDVVDGECFLHYRILR